jgi:hypothetical protein
MSLTDLVVPHLHFGGLLDLVHAHHVLVLACGHLKNKSGEHKEMRPAGERAASSASRILSFSINDDSL